MQNILVVGGNGFIGSAVCKAALTRGMRVTSLSSSGRPFRTPKGHAPAWTERVEWRAADAFNPEQYASLLDGKTAVVHTLGILFESRGGQEGGYKQALKKNDLFGFVGAVGRGVTNSIFGGGKNPLEEGEGEYERMNRDSALTVCSAFSGSVPPDVPAASETATDGLRSRRAFIYLSAEDIFRPFVPSRYIETKRAAERGIAEILDGREDMRAVFVRPSLVYHSHYRPLTTPIATLLDLSATVHHTLPSYAPTPAGLLRAISSSSSTPSVAPGTLNPSVFASVANALTVPPIHVDHVAEAIVRAIADDDVEGVMDVRRMREIIGWVEKGSSPNDRPQSRTSSNVSAHDQT
ncbi:hypothetical protein ACEPAI_4706 [Sanghuangporus weigelae]